MKQTYAKIVAAACILAFSTIDAVTSTGHITTFIPRSQGANTARELVGWQRDLFRCYTENYAAIAGTIEYTRSFELCDLARKLFSTPALTFAGSQNIDRVNGVDIVADYFGLPTNFHGTLIIKPRIENVIIDLNFYFGLDDICDGLFLRVHAPITHTKWSLGLDSCLACGDKFRGSSTFPLCYMGPNTPTAGQCPINATLNPIYLAPQDENANCTTHSLREALSGNFTFGDMLEPWRYGRFDFCPRSRTGLADIDVILGFDLLHNDYGHFAFFALTVVPTGNRPKAKFIFEPLVGNGKHWQLGGGFSGHFSFFGPTNADTCNLALYVEGNVTHVFSTDQKRSFDFLPTSPIVKDCLPVPSNDKLLSRYILLKEFDINDNYSGHLINAINFATRNCEVSIGIQSDVSAKLCFLNRGWAFDLGYNFYFQEKEKVCIKTECPCAIDQRRFGIKGLEGVCCVSYDCTGAIATETVLNTTQNDATMFTAELPTSAPLPTSPPFCLSWNTNPNPTSTSDLIQANLNAEPYIISCRDLNPASAAQGRMMTHKVFGHVSYTFNSCYEPHIGIGAEAEFDGHCDNALEQWGVWMKGGFVF